MSSPIPRTYNSAEVEALRVKLAPTIAQFNGTQLARLFNVSRWTITAVKIAAAQSGDSPFRGHYATVADLKAWFRRHPEFVAAHFIRKTPPRRLGLSLPPQAAGKSGESSLTHGPQTPSPATPAPQLAPSA